MPVKKKAPLTRAQKMLLNCLELEPSRTNLNIRIPQTDLNTLQEIADALGVSKAKAMRAMIRQTAAKVLA
jgi:DNA-binding MarR family transcriptional regulator